MHSHRSASLAAAAAALVIAGAALAGPAGPAPDATLDPTRVGWSTLRMSGSKLFVSADARLDASLVPGGSVAAGLRTPPAGRPVAPGPEVLRLVYDGAAAGRRSRATLLLDPRTAAGIQRVQEDFGGRQRYREYRYTDIGAYHWTRWPEAGEGRLPPARWTRTSEGARPYGRVADAAVLEPTSLIYAVAAADLDAPGDRARFLIFQRRVLQDVVAEVAGRRGIDVDYVDETGGGTARRRGRVDALRILLRGDPGQAGGDDELELLGLRGDLELLLDPATRAPLQLTGSVAVLGQVTLRLRALRRAAPLAGASAGT